MGNPLGVVTPGERASGEVIVPSQVGGARTFVTPFPAWSTGSVTGPQKIALPGKISQIALGPRSDVDAVICNMSENNQEFVVGVGAPSPLGVYRGSMDVSFKRRFDGGPGQSYIAQLAAGGLFVPAELELYMFDAPGLAVPMARVPKRDTVTIAAPAAQTVGQAQLMLPFHGRRTYCLSVRNSSGGNLSWQIFAQYDSSSGFVPLNAVRVVANGADDQQAEDVGGNSIPYLAVQIYGTAGNATFAYDLRDGASK